jgi:hypothetical protein
VKHGSVWFYSNCRGNAALSPEASEKSCTAEQLVRELLVAKKADGVFERHLRDIRGQLGVFAEKFNGQMVAAITSSSTTGCVRSTCLQSRAITTGSSSYSLSTSRQNADMRPTIRQRKPTRLTEERATSGFSVSTKPRACWTAQRRTFCRISPSDCSPVCVARKLSDLIGPD